MIEHYDELQLILFKFNSYQSQYTSKRETRTRYMYTCAQSQERKHKSQKGKQEDAKLRDRQAMARFDCHGWLHITLSNDDHTALVKITHGDSHIPYYCIDVPEDIKKFVYENLNMMPSQVRTSIDLLRNLRLRFKYLIIAMGFYSRKGSCADILTSSYLLFMVEKEQSQMETGY